MEKLSAVVDWLYGLWVKSLSDKEVQDNYVEAGAVFGDAVGCLYLGQCPDFKKMFLAWAKWELEYSGRGYQTFPLGDFVLYFNGCGRPLDGLGVKRELKEQAVLYADAVKKKYFD